MTSSFNPPASYCHKPYAYKKVIRNMNNDNQFLARRDTETSTKLVQADGHDRFYILFANAVGNDALGHNCKRRNSTVRSMKSGRGGLKWAYL